MKRKLGKAPNWFRKVAYLTQAFVLVAAVVASSNGLVLPPRVLIPLAVSVVLLAIQDVANGRL